MSFHFDIRLYWNAPFLLLKAVASSRLVRGSTTKTLQNRQCSIVVVAKYLRAANTNQVFSVFVSTLQVTTLTKQKKRARKMGVVLPLSKQMYSLHSRDCINALSNFVTYS